MFFYSIKELPEFILREGIKIKEVSLEKNMMTFMEFQPHFEIAPHQHPHEQISTIISGKAEFTVKGVAKVLYPGDICALPSNVEHSVKILDEQTVIYDSWSPVREDYIITRRQLKQDKSNDL